MEAHKSSAEDCEEVVCLRGDVRHKLRRHLSDVMQSQEITKPVEKEEPEVECPLNRAALGYYTWSFLHTMAAYYPTHPTASDKKSMSSFIESFARFYPCKVCAVDFQAKIREIPPKLESQTDFSIWMCIQHNEVNRRLGKPEFDCSVENLTRRWRTGDEKCRVGNKSSGLH
eukprot:TRINITY_DN10853_c0_g1_i1.p2 TRINITY_DN10853_c0_g1~~TRINITY_DN10853_c0_g1_i1.p2  ORF type:complete len:171 (+),score=29.17 TRINITY_DN10853_c0_g1_i1:29-541(+)